jgi:hypothetical protein
MPDLNKETYLGDGVYGRFDGVNVWLRTDREGHSHEVAISFDNWQAIDEFCCETIGETDREG